MSRLRGFFSVQHKKPGFAVSCKSLSDWDSLEGVNPCLIRRTLNNIHAPVDIKESTDSVAMNKHVQDMLEQGGGGGTVTRPNIICMDWTGRSWFCINNLAGQSVLCFDLCPNFFALAVEYDREQRSRGKVCTYFFTLSAIGLRGRCRNETLRAGMKFAAAAEAPYTGCFFILAVWIKEFLAWRRSININDDGYIYLLCSELCLKWNRCGTRLK